MIRTLTGLIVLPSNLNGPRERSKKDVTAPGVNWSNTQYILQYQPNISHLLLILIECSDMTPTRTQVGVDRSWPAHKLIEQALKDGVTSLLNWAGWSFFAEIIIPGRRREMVISRERNNRFGNWWVFQDQWFENYLIPPWSTENIFRILPATHCFTEASANRFLPIAYEESGWFYKPENDSRLYLIVIW
jgi:hypothetical protein